MKKISDKESSIITDEKRLLREQEKSQKKEAKESQRFQEQVKNNNNQLKDQLTAQSISQQEIKRAVEDLSKVPEHINILFMASNPINSGKLRLDEEAREIEQMIKKAKHRDSVTLSTSWAARPLDMLQSINELNPTVVHFSGHGSSEHELVFQNDQGQAKLVSKEAIVQTMLSTSESIRLVFFNSCFSYGQAEAVVEHVDVAIGMTESIGDEAAKVFAAQFYSAISFGQSVQKSFDQAKAALLLEDIPESHIPELYIKETLNSDDIVIVHP